MKTYRIILGLLWMGFVIYALLLAPPDDPATLELIKNLSLGQWQGVNPSVVSLFNLMGVWPAVYSCILLTDGHNQWVKAWPFLVASFGLGAFALLPYLILRSPNDTVIGNPDWVLRITNSRWIAGVLLMITIGLGAYGFSQGDWGNFTVQWQTNRFIHVMGLDFCLLALLFSVLVPDDLIRRKTRQGIWLRAIAAIPLLGAILYLLFRPPLTQDQ